MPDFVRILAAAGSFSLLAMAVAFVAWPKIAAWLSQRAAFRKSVPAPNPIVADPQDEAWGALRVLAERTDKPELRAAMLEIVLAERNQS